MQAFITLITGFLFDLLIKPLSRLLAGFFQFASERTLYIASLLALSIAFLAAMSSAINAILSSIGATMPPVLADGMAAVFPTNAPECIAAIYSSKLVIFIYQYKNSLLEKMSNLV